MLVANVLANVCSQPMKIASLLDKWTSYNETIFLAGECSGLVKNLQVYTQISIHGKISWHRHRCFHTITE
jgi:hypothetical protein